MPTTRRALGATKRHDAESDEGAWSGGMPSVSWIVSWNGYGLVSGYMLPYGCSERDGDGQFERSTRRGRYTHVLSHLLWMSSSIGQHTHAHNQAQLLQPLWMSSKPHSSMAMQAWRSTRMHTDKHKYYSRYGCRPNRTQTYMRKRPQATWKTQRGP